MHTVNFMRRIGEPPARVPHRKTSHRDVLLPLLRFVFQGFRVLRDASQGFAPAPHRLLKKAGENISCNIFRKQLFLQSATPPLNAKSIRRGRCLLFTGKRPRPCRHILRLYPRNKYAMIRCTCTFPLLINKYGFAAVCRGRGDSIF